MGRTETFPWDGADNLRTEEDVIACLEVALGEDDPRVIALALDDICRSEVMARVAPDAALPRASLQKAMSANGELEFGAVLSVVRALGLRLRAESVTAASPGHDAGSQQAKSRRSARPTRIFRRPAVARK